MFADCKSLDVLENKRSRPQFANQTDEFLHKLIAGVIKHSMSDEGKPLAWRATKNDIHRFLTKSRSRSQLLSGQPDNRPCEDHCFRKIEMMYSGMNRVNLDGGSDIEPCLLEPQ